MAQVKDPVTGQFKTLYVKALDSLPIGIILEFPTTDPTKLPNGYMFCDGSAISRVDYSELFGLIGTKFGVGDGSTTFNLPTKEGLVSVGIKSSDTAFDTIGETGGAKTHTHSDGTYYTTARVDGTTLYFADKAQSWNPSFRMNGSSSGSASGTQSAAFDVNGTSGSSSSLQPYTVTNYIIKVKHTRALAGNIVNAYNDSQTSAYSTEYINDINNYSTSEVNTGKKWIDGKPIYRKVLKTTSFNTGNNNVAHGITNLDELVFITGTAYINNKWQPLPRVVTDALGTYGTGIGDVGNTYVLLQIGTGYSTRTKAYIILEYTKTS